MPKRAKIWGATPEPLCRARMPENLKFIHWGGSEALVMFVGQGKNPRIDDHILLENSFHKVSGPKQGIDPGRWKRKVQDVGDYCLE
ncbi:hypothetical protein CLCR_06485 [Cladophialophora carrionii]|uniref:Uncharacterized protein n=1 Tax=Cladophialophora carrionii TaxID=86049 RepID=A0A1C1C942_9EURO|nr:hypothetical protein CLCR_06485 [Cladophialophora carrionii]